MEDCSDTNISRWHPEMTDPFSDIGTIQPIKQNHCVRASTDSPVHVVPRCPGEMGLRDRSSCSRCARSSSLVVRAMHEPRKLPLPLLPP